MTETAYMVNLHGVTDRKALFTELLAFFAPHEVVLTTWGELTPKARERLTPFKAPCSWVRRLAFHEMNWHLTPDSLPTLTRELCADGIFRDLAWGLIKSETPLGLCRSWNDVYLNGSSQIDKKTLIIWLDDLKARKLFHSYETTEKEPNACPARRDIPYEWAKDDLPFAVIWPTVSANRKSLRELGEQLQAWMAGSNGVKHIIGLERLLEGRPPEVSAFDLGIPHDPKVPETGVDQVALVVVDVSAAQEGLISSLCDLVERSDTAMVTSWEQFSYMNR